MLLWDVDERSHIEAGAALKDDLVNGVAFAFQRSHVARIERGPFGKRPNCLLKVSHQLGAPQLPLLRGLYGRACRFGMVE